MHIVHVSPLDPRELEGAFERLRHAECSAALCLLAPGDSSHLLAELGDRAARSSLPVFGGVVPGVVREGAVDRDGAVLLGLPGDVQIAVVDPADASGIRDAVAHIARDDVGTVFAFVDVLAGTATLVETLFERLGHRATIVGGGLGLLDFQPRPVVLGPDGLVEGRAVLAATSLRSRSALRHGWAPISDPLLVTAAAGHDLLTLNWRPAVEAYREVVEKHAGRSLDDDFHGVASRYPLVVDRIGAEGIVRDPLLALASGALRLAGDIPAHATVRVAHASADTMITAAAAAMASATAAPVSRGAVAFVVDCISRALVLGDRFPEELAALRVPGIAQGGALTIGEIAHSGGDMLHFHNKSCVLTLLEAE